MIINSNTNLRNVSSSHFTRIRHYETITDLRYGYSWKRVWQIQLILVRNYFASSHLLTCTGLTSLGSPRGSSPPLPADWWGRPWRRRTLVTGRVGCSWWCVCCGRRPVSDWVSTLTLIATFPLRLLSSPTLLRQDTAGDLTTCSSSGAILSTRRLIMVNLQTRARQHSLHWVTSHWITIINLLQTTPERLLVAIIRNYLMPTRVYIRLIHCREYTCLNNLDPQLISDYSLYYHVHLIW